MKAEEWRKWGWERSRLNSPNKDSSNAAEALHFVCAETENIEAQRDELLEAVKYAIESINPQSYCRGMFPSLEGGHNRAYVGSKGFPSDEAILRLIEAIENCK